MTYKEKLKAEHPDYTEADVRETVRDECPHHFFNEALVPTWCWSKVSDEECMKCWDREIEENESKPVLESSPHIKDSGDRTEFESGAVRDMREGKGRCDLAPIGVMSRYAYYIEDDEESANILGAIESFQRSQDTDHLYNALGTFCKTFIDWPTMFLEVAKHFEEGAKKYGESNWQKGIPAKCYVDSAVRHYLKWKRGDNDEPHNRAFVWNLMCCIWEVDCGEEYRASKN